MSVKKSLNVFIVDDDEFNSNVLSAVLVNQIDFPINVRYFPNGEECLKNLHLKPDVVILDYFLKSEENNQSKRGSYILKKILKFDSKTKVIMLSSQDSVEIAVETLRNGAYDYVFKSETAFLRINGIIQKIGGNHLSDSKKTKEVGIAKNLNFLVLLIFIFLFVLSRLI